ncbi:hypothetical protein B0O80DRAFT_445211 [Mortierella sp. GBAus27b]|nr:hypothetical protein B0O80DRAFT_445211 [Mortierella sp. GBAus27b]
MNTGEQELSSSIQTPPPPQVNAVIDDNIKVEVGRPTSQILSEPAPVSTEKVLVEGEAVHPVQVSTPKSESGSVTFPEPAQEHGSGSPGSSPTISDGHARQHALGADEDEKAAESDDDFEDAEEEMSKPTDEEVKERESRREQSERASRLIGQKMLQGWTMLQDLCPNPSCHEVLLLRNREKKEYCVICENYFQREQDLEHGKYTIVSATNDNSASTTSPASTTPQGQPGTTSPAPVVPESLSPPPQGPSGQPLQLSPAIPPQFSSPRLKSVTSPIASPSFGRNQRELLGRVSNPILLPPVTTSMTSQQVLSKHMSEDLDRLASEDEEARKHINMIRKVGEYTSRTLPPVPMAPPPPRPMSTYSNSSDSDRHEGKLSRHASSHRHGSGLTSQQGSSAQLVEGNPSTPPPPPPPPLSPEVQALVAATHKTIATILVKLEACRSALEVADSPKECQVLTNQIKSLMECLKACREAL